MAVATTGPATLDVVFVAGDDWQMTVRAKDTGGTPIDLSAATIVGQVRAYPAAVDKVDVTVDMTDAAAGEVTLSLAAAATAAMSGRLVWDLQVTRAGATRTWLAGAVTVVEQVSR